MTQLVITLKDQSYLPNIRRIVKSLQGVESVTTSRWTRATQKKVTITPKRNNINSVKRKAGQQPSDPLEALESISSLVCSTGKTSAQLIDEHLTEKYGL